MFREVPGKILVRFWHFPIMTLGPGRRLGIWLQGCSIHCEGCIAPENQPFDEKFSVSIAELVNELAPFLREADGVTISGGEPLDQSEALIELLRLLRANGQEDILLYSGYTKEKILSDCPEISELVAALVDGPFIAGNVTKSLWKGSDNQTLTIFRESRKYSAWRESSGRKVQFIKKGNEAYLIGIPRQEDDVKNFLRSEIFDEHDKDLSEL